MTAYYNEIDPYAAQWLRNLIQEGLIAKGDVDERSISDVKPNEITGYTQCHFFAGIGIWSLALRNAGWPDDKPVWTGSCPCQPFSSAGAGKGFDDERHLWPDFHWLIQQCQPEVVFGEQVARGGGLEWIDLVQTEMEASGYEFGASILSSGGFGAAQIRERFFFCADTKRIGQQGQGGRIEPKHTAENFYREAGWFVDAVQGGALPFVCGRHNGNSSGMDRLRAIGNAIDPNVATNFIRAYMECRP